MTHDFIFHYSTDMKRLEIRFFKITSRGGCLIFHLLIWPVEYPNVLFLIKKLHCKNGFNVNDLSQFCLGARKISLAWRTMYVWIYINVWLSLRDYVHKKWQWQLGQVERSFHEPANFLFSEARLSYSYITGYAYTSVSYTHLTLPTTPYV